MADRSPLKTQSTGRKSPAKRQQTANADQRSGYDSKDLIQGISEKEVEIEHLKTVIVALDEKVKVIDSVREDLAILHSHLQ